MGAIIYDHGNIRKALEAADAVEGKKEAELIVAARDCKPAEAARLLADGANTDAHPIGYDPPLILAARGGCKTVVKLLISSGADVKVKGQNERTALMYAAERGYKDTVDDFINNDACDTVEAVDQQRGYTATMFANTNNHPEILQLLRSRCNVLIPTDNVYVMQHGLRYHVGGCSVVTGAVARETTLEEAFREQLLPCHFCLKRQ